LKKRRKYARARGDKLSRRRQMRLLTSVVLYVSAPVLRPVSVPPPCGTACQTSQRPSSASRGAFGVEGRSHLAEAKEAVVNIDDNTAPEDSARKIVLTGRRPFWPSGPRRCMPRPPLPAT